MPGIMQRVGSRARRYSCVERVVVVGPFRENSPAWSLLWGSAFCALRRVNPAVG